MIAALRSVLAQTSGTRWEVVQGRSESGAVVHRICEAGEPLVLFVEGPGIPAPQGEANATLIVTSKNLLPPVLDALEAALTLIRTAQIFVDEDSETQAAKLMDKLSLLGMADHILPQELQSETRD
jgi:hypothetical protein